MKKVCIAALCILIAAAAFGGCKSAPAKPEESLQAMPEESTQTKPEESIQARAEAAYREILLVAPAISGGHKELEDLTFNYEQNLERFGNHYDLFAVTDINGDGIPELIALTEVNFRWTPISVFTFADGEAVLLKDPLDPMAHGTFEQYSLANGAYTTYLCEESHIHSVWQGNTPVGEMEENHAYALTGTTLTETTCSVGEQGKTVDFRDIAKENVEANLP